MQLIKQCNPLSIYFILKNSLRIYTLTSPNGRLLSLFAKTSCLSGDFDGWEESMVCVASLTHTVATVILLESVKNCCQMRVHSPEGPTLNLQVWANCLCAMQTQFQMVAGDETETKKCEGRIQQIKVRSKRYRKKRERWARGRGGARDGILLIQCLLIKQNYFL